MHIGVDIDSVIAEVMPPLLKYFNKKYKTSIKKHQHITYMLTPTFHITYEEALKGVYEFYDSIFFNQVKPVQGSRSGINYLSKKYNLSAITSRPFSIEEKTIQWLDTYFPRKFSSVHHTNQVSWSNEPKKKKSEIASKLGIDLFIDDHLDFAEDVASIGVPVLLFNQPWNQIKQLPKGVKRVYSWKEIRGML